MKPLLAISLLCAGLSTAAFANDHAKGEEGSKMHGDHKGRMEHMFKKLDANDDGVITKEESTAHANKKFEENDANKDGKVTKEEWNAAREKKHKEWQEKRGKMKNPEQTKPADTSVPEVVKKP